MTTVAAVAEAIGIPAEKWPGRCYEIAGLCKLAGVVKGLLCYGHYIGPVTPGTLFAGKPIVRHGWVELKDYRVWDPTRWVIEGRSPYIYTGTGEDYDYGGQRLLEMMQRPAPTPLPAKAIPHYRLRLDKPVLAWLGKNLGVTRFYGGISLDQAHWIANLPLRTLGEMARPIYLELKRLRLEARVPLDHWTRVFKHRKPLEPNCHSGWCAKCGRSATQDDYCYGCRRFVCERCETALGGIGPGHAVEAHWDNEDDE